MCWNATASLVAFVVGVLVTGVVCQIAYKQKKWHVFALSLGWLWVISMQLWEYFIWTNPPPFPNNIMYSKMAFVFNVTQVLVLGLLFLTFFKTQGVVCRATASVILLLYMSFICYYMSSVSDFSTFASCSNPHLVYPWWKDIPYGGLVYMMALVSVFLLLVRPIGWSVQVLSVILGLFGVSWVLYSGAVASMWCFFAVAIPVISLLLSL